MLQSVGARRIAGSPAIRYTPLFRFISARRAVAARRSNISWRSEVPISVRSRSLRFAAALSVALIAQAAFAQPPAPTKNWQNGEYPMYEAATKEAQPVKRLDLLEAWKQKFPKTDYEDVRQQAYLQTYSQVMTSAYSSQDPQVWAAGGKSADAVMSNFDTLFSFKPTEVSDADWA